jgi:hypothetical protein
MLIFRRTHCIHAAYGTVTLYESSWWLVGAVNRQTITNKIHGEVGRAKDLSAPGIIPDNLALCVTSGFGSGVNEIRFLLRLDTE